MRVLLTLFVAMGVAAAYAEEVRSAITAGNADYDAGRYAEALKKYDEAGEPGDPSAAADLLHNRAAAQFKLGAIDEARELWVRASAMKDAAFEAACHYNLGNCDYADALKAAERGDGGAAIAALKKATARYRDALRLDPGLANARANLELAGALQKQLEQAPTSQPDSQSSSSQEGQPDKNTSQPSQNQQQNPDKKGEEEKQDGQSSTQPNGEQQQQPSSQPESGEPQSQPADQPQPSEGQNDNQSNDNGQSQQPENSEPQNANQNDNQQQPSPAEAESNENANDNSQSPQPQPVATQPADGSEQEGEPNPLLNMTREQAERLLQKVRDMEKARRQALLQRERTRHKPVDKDW